MINKTKSIKDAVLERDLICNYCSNQATDLWQVESGETLNSYIGVCYTCLKKLLNKQNSINKDQLIYCLKLINYIIHPRRMSESYLSRFQRSIKRYNYSYQELLDAIEIAKKYLYLSDSGELSGPSVNDFLEKLGGILYNKKFKK
jgi:hypothetical protein